MSTEQLPLPPMTHYGGTAVVMSAAEIRARDAEVARAAIAAYSARRGGDPVRILRREGSVAMGLSHYLLTDFTQRTMSSTQAEKMEWWDAEKHPIPIATHPAPQGADAEQAAMLESVAKVIYAQWWRSEGYKPWVDGGNSINQDRARDLARAAMGKEAGK